MPEATLFPTAARSGAGLSPCGRYRYWLTRTWDPAVPPVCWLMLNPSTADASIDDPTIRRCMAFARAWGAGGIAVVNLFALRATDRRELRRHPHPVAEQGIGGTHPLYENVNDAWIINQSDGRRLIVAWGCEGTHLARDRAVLKLLANRRVECLGVTKDGHPRHPLYLADATLPQPFKMPEVAHA
jgi:hypothetical protein